MRALIEQGFDGYIEQIGRMRAAITPTPGRGDGSGSGAARSSAVDASGARSAGALAFEALATAYASDPTNTLWSLEFQLAAVRHPELREEYSRQFDRLRTAVRDIVSDELSRNDSPVTPESLRFADVFIAILSGLGLIRILDPEKVPDGTFADVYEALVAGIPVTHPPAN